VAVDTPARLATSVTVTPPLPSPRCILRLPNAVRSCLAVCEISVGG
jgi:hypothetical protein